MKAPLDVRALNPLLSLALLAAVAAGCASGRVDPDGEPGGGGGKEDAFGNREEGASCTWNWQCRGDKNFVCREGTCQLDTNCMFYSNLIVEDTGEEAEAAELSAQGTVVSGELEVTEALATGMVIERSHVRVRPGPQAIFSIAVDDPDLAFEVWARDVGEDHWNPLWASPDRGGENIWLFHDAEFNFTNVNASYDGRNQCLEARNGVQPIWAYDYTAVELAHLGEVPVELEIAVVPVADLEVGSYPYELTLTQHRE